MNREIEKLTCLVHGDVTFARRLMHEGTGAARVADLEVPADRAVVALAQSEAGEDVEIPRRVSRGWAAQEERGAAGRERARGYGSLVSGVEDEGAQPEPSVVLIGPDPIRTTRKT